MNISQQNKSFSNQQETDKAAKKTVKKKNDGMKKHMLRKLMHIFIMLLFIGAVAAAYYIPHRIHKDAEASVKTLALLKHQIANSSQIIEQQKQITSENRKAIEHIQKFTDKQKYNLHLAEAEYLAETANLSLRFEHNVPKAIEMLKAADFYFRSSGIINIINVRKILIKDIFALQSVPKIDISGLYLYLQSIDDQLDKLPFSNMDLVSAEKSPEKILASLPSWKKALITSWQGIKQVLIIHHYKEPIAPVLSSQQQTLLILNLHILIAKAQWALLHRQNDVYLSNLKKIHNNVKRHFLHTNTAVKQILKSLTELEKTNIAPKIPDISNSVEAIRNLRTAKLKTITNIKPNKTSETEQDKINRTAK